MFSCYKNYFRLVFCFPLSGGAFTERRFKAETERAKGLRVSRRTFSLHGVKDKSTHAVAFVLLDMSKQWFL
jgi:hypothetical protein